MRWSFLLVACIAGSCGFSLSAPAVERDAGGDAAADGSTDAAVDATVDGPVDPGNPCAVVDSTNLVVCFAFDDDLADGIATDGSANGLHAMTSGLTTISRPLAVGVSPAASVGVSASTKVPESPLLELAGTFTLSAWILPVSHPGNEGLVDREGTYAMSVLNDGNLRCWHNRAAGLATQSTGPVTLGEWQYAACRWDGTRLCSILIPVTGATVQTCSSLSASGPATGAFGVSVGSMQNGGGAAESQFNGALDDYRIYARALTNSELCALGNRSATCLP